MGNIQIKSGVQTMKISLGWHQVEKKSVVDYNDEFDTRVIITEACSAEFAFSEKLNT